MKIAVLLFEVANNPGGVIPSTFNMCKGLKEIGHEPKLFHAEWKTRSENKESEEWKKAGFGMLTKVMSDQRARLAADGEHTVLYKGREAAEELRDRLSEFDGVILTSSIPSFGNKKHKDNHDWNIVLKHGKPMISMIRDCHWESYSLRIIPYRHLFQCFVGVHPAAFESLKSMPWKIACQVNPFDIGMRLDTDKDWEKVCVTSWFKKWKHIDDVIRATPYMKPIDVHISGGGIEKEYMLAAKNNPDAKSAKGYQDQIQFYTWKKQDVGVKKDWIGESIWSVAENSGNFFYDGFLRGKSLITLQSECGGLIDPSYNMEWGEHFNRVLIEAMICGCIPFARPFGISDNSKGVGNVFGPDNVVLIPENASPKRFAEIVKSSLKDSKLVGQIQLNNKKKMSMFDRKEVAKNYVRLLKGKEAGLFGIEEGKISESLQRRMLKYNIDVRFPRTKYSPRIL